MWFARGSKLGPARMELPFASVASQGGVLECRLLNRHTAVTRGPK